MVEDRRGIVRDFIAQSAHKGAGIHRCLQTFTAAHIADDDEEGIVFEREHLKEISTDAVGGQVSALKHEVMVRRQLRGDEHGLHAARGFNLRGGALLFLADVDKPVEDYGNETGEKDRIVDGAGGEFYWAEMKMREKQVLRRSNVC